MACNMQRFIKLWQRRNGVDDDTYRDFLHSVTGKRSTTEMSRMERWRVVEALKAKGARLENSRHMAEVMNPSRAAGAGGRQDAKRDNSPQSRLVRHLWLKLKNYGVLRDSSEWALLAYVERITNRKRLEWLSPQQMSMVIDTLKAWVARIEEELPRSA
jgi:phage gp16-like protein